MATATTTNLPVRGVAVVFEARFISLPPSLFPSLPPSCRHELQHFITVMQGYLTNQLFHLSWGEFETELGQNVSSAILHYIIITSGPPAHSQVHSLDELIQAHKKFIDKMIFRLVKVNLLSTILTR